MKKEQKNLKAWLSYSVIILVFIIGVVFIYIYYSQSNVKVDDDFNNEKASIPTTKNKNAEPVELKNKTINLYFFNNKQPIKDNTVIISYLAKMPGFYEKFFDVCVGGACKINTLSFPINLIKTNEKNILTDCEWKAKFIEILGGKTFKVNYYSEYKKIMNESVDQATKNIEFNPCDDDKNCPDIQDGGNYSFDLSDNSLNLIDLSKYPTLKKEVEINNHCYYLDHFKPYN